MNPPFQFSLRSLMLLVLIIGVITGLLTMPYTWSSLVLVLGSLVLPPTLVLGLTRGKGDTRRFCAGALVPALILALSGVVILCQWLFSQAGNGEAALDAFMRRFFVRDQCLIMFGLAILAGTICILSQEWTARATARARASKSRPRKRAVFRIMLQVGGYLRHDVQPRQRAPWRTYELSRRLRGNREVLLRAEYLPHA